MRILTFGLNGALEIGLHAEGCVLYVTQTLDELLETAALAVPRLDTTVAEDFDAIILGMDEGADEVTLRELRALGLKHAIVAISGSDDEEYLATLYDSGASDVVQLPCSKRLLFRKVRGLARLASGNPIGIQHVGDLIVDLGRKEVADVNGRRIHLTTKEWSVLELLVMRRGSVVTKDGFMSHLYGGFDDPDLKIVDVFICKLRNKLRDADPAHEHIATEWGRGYKLDGSPRSAASAAE